LKRFIPVASPALVGNEKSYVMDCLESNWISSCGEYVQRFEEAFARFCGMNHAISCCNGTAALHLALLAMGVVPGDEVIVPTLTFVATANAVTYCGAHPVFLDSEPDTWNLNPSLIEELITPRTKGMIVVHLFGHPVDMDPVLRLAQKRGLFVIEDASEAHGGEYEGRKLGSLGQISTFSFYGNKILTTGEGGIVVTNRPDIATAVLQLKGQGMDLSRRYWFPVIGYNYRMTNIAAAIGLAQLERADWHLSRRRTIAAEYTRRLGEIPYLHLQGEKPYGRHAYWMIGAVVDERCRVSRDTLARRLADAGIETRPFFYPVHTLPMYKPLSKGQDFPVAESLASRGLMLPSSAQLTEDDVAFVCDRLIEALDPPTRSACSK
jgi:perosamine synthetase